MITLPEGWQVAQLGDVATPEAPSAIPAEQPTFPYLGLDNVSKETGQLLGLSDPEGFTSSAYVVEPGTVLYSRLRPYLNKVLLASETLYTSREFIPLTPLETVRASFLAPRLRASDFVEFAIGLNTGDRPRVKWPQMRQFKVLLPPLAEQDEIVRILDTQLARLDSVLEAVQAVRDKADQFRRSLLYAAFTGQLTQPDPRRMTDLPEDWAQMTLGDVASWGSGGTPKSTNPDYYDGPIPWLQSGELEDGTIFSTEKSITELGLAESSAKLIKAGSLLVAMYGATRGKVGIAGVMMASNQAVAFAQPDTSLVSTTYMRFALMASRKELIATGKGGAQANISQTVLKAWPIAVAPLPEQDEIVRILDTQLARLDKALEVADRVEVECGRLRRSLLQAAFAGELTKKWREANV